MKLKADHHYLDGRELCRNCKIICEFDPRHLVPTNELSETTLARRDYSTT